MLVDFCRLLRFMFVCLFGKLFGKFDIEEVMDCIYLAASHYEAKEAGKFNPENYGLLMQSWNELSCRERCFIDAMIIPNTPWLKKHWRGQCK